MSRSGANKQLFALTAPPPERVTLITGGTYRLRRVFKHDFYAATCLYEGIDKPDPPMAVVKYCRRQSFCGIPMDWLARLLTNNEAAIYRTLEGLEGVPRYLGPVGSNGYAIEYIDARPLDHFDKPPKGFFDRLLALMRQVHARGVAYTDANKRSNILVRPDGRPALVDYQISFRRRDDWPWPLCRLSRRLFAYMTERDIYHLLKHKRRMVPEELREDEEAISRKRGRLHRAHRKFIEGWKRFRRGFLHSRHNKGTLNSPTADLEDHHQPEKGTWRDTQQSARSK